VWIICFSAQEPNDAPKGKAWIPVESAGVPTNFAIIWTVRWRREEVARLRPTSEKEEAKETDFVVNIISVIGRAVKQNLKLFQPFLVPADLLLMSVLAGAGGAPARTFLGRGLPEDMG
jgi:hypothetical protein